MAKKTESQILVQVSDSTLMRSGENEEIPVSKIKKELSKFLNEIEGILEEASTKTSHAAYLSEVTLSAAVHSGGKLSLLGSGVEVSAKAGITFKFTFPQP
ncbi:hypothetical protein B0E33_11400 [Roseibium algicola]|uniref:Pepco domain-containing protein n=1 Tax=Roseibium algicola TaxID=2857014 RepID=A0ABN4WVD7_9HYPH|nr:hypothetical protein [Roseibium aggregatum]AQQ04121.1 hypothetical protein B0E33_11400 [Roseibium aggregatum]